MAIDSPNEFKTWGPKGTRVSCAKLLGEVHKVTRLQEAPHCPGVTFPLDDPRNKGKKHG